MNVKSLLTAAALIPLAACARDETITGYGALGLSWTLTEINETPFDASATLTFPEAGRLAGRAPCNSFTAEITKPYPWFGTGPVAVTRALCPDQPKEDVFFKSLAVMEIAEVTGDTLILSTSDGQTMIFKALSEEVQ